MRSRMMHTHDQNENDDHMKPSEKLMKMATKQTQPKSTDTSLNISQAHLLNFAVIFVFTFFADFVVALTSL